MTKAKARSLATFLDVRCDDAFLFVVKVGKSGYIIDIDEKLF